MSATLVKDRLDTQTIIKKTKEQINRELISKSHEGCSESKKQVIELNLGLAQDIANKYNGKTNEYEDILQIAYLALIKAVDRFDLTKTNNFSTFAYYTIQGEIYNHFRNFSPIRRKSTSNYLYKKIQDFQYNYYSRNGSYPRTYETAEYLNIDVKEIEETINENQPLYYLSDNPISNNDSDKDISMADIIPSKNDDYETFLLRETINSILNEEERLIFNYNFNGMCKREIADIFGVSEGKIRKEIKKITKKLSNAIFPQGVLN